HHRDHNQQQPRTYYCRQKCCVRTFRRHIPPARAHLQSALTQAYYTTNNARLQAALRPPLSRNWALPAVSQEPLTADR
ncbi:MAG: hypothetical protein KAW49_01235, partial [Anaerolineae bacterium]|nr:hypothetical protein [Anaerolineae bacterium]